MQLPRDSAEGSSTLRAVFTGVGERPSMCTLARRMILAFSVHAVLRKPFVPRSFSSGDEGRRLRHLIGAATAASGECTLGALSSALPQLVRGRRNIHGSAISAHPTRTSVSVGGELRRSSPHEQRRYQPRSVGDRRWTRIPPAGSNYDNCERRASPVQQVRLLWRH